MLAKAPWLNWLIVDENFKSKLRDDAPEDIKKDYEEYKKLKEELKKRHIKI